MLAKLLVLLHSRFFFSFVFAKFYSLWYKIKKENLHIFDFYIFFYIFFVYVILVYFSFFEVSENAGDQFRVFFAFFLLILFDFKTSMGCARVVCRKKKKNRGKNKRFSCSSMLVEEIPMYYIKLANMSDYTRRDKLPQSGIPYTIYIS